MSIDRKMLGWLTLGILPVVVFSGALLSALTPETPSAIFVLVPLPLIGPGLFLIIGELFAARTATDVFWIFLFLLCFNSIIFYLFGRYHRFLKQNQKSLKPLYLCLLLFYSSGVVVLGLLLFILGGLAL